MTKPEPLVVAGREFHSRLILGTGKYRDEQLMVDAFDASGTEMVTVALRRVNLDDLGKGSLIDHIDQERYLLLPNTAACFTADDAIRTARLARELGGWNWVKLEVIGDEKTLFPDNEELLVATKELVDDGFIVLPYTTDDPITCRKLEDLGAAAVMPLAAPIGSGMGIRNPANLRIIVEQAHVPVIVDAGVGTASGRRPGHGARRGRRADEHRRRRRQGSGAHGPGDETRGRSRLAGCECRPDPQEAVCDCVVAGGWGDRLGALTWPGPEDPRSRERNPALGVGRAWIVRIAAEEAQQAGVRDHRRVVAAEPERHKQYFDATALAPGRHLPPQQTVCRHAARYRKARHGTLGAEAIQALDQLGHGGAPETRQQVEYLPGPGRVVTSGRRRRNLDPGQGSPPARAEPDSSGPSTRTPARSS